MDKITWLPETNEAYYAAVTEELEGYYHAVEKRCEHLEAIVNSATALLQVVVGDLQSPYVKPILGAIVERLNSLAAFMQTGLDTAPNPDNN